MSEPEQAPTVFVPEEGQPVPHVPAGKRYVGLCRSCRRFVELGPTFACLDGGHAKGDVVLALLIGREERLPRLPKMNWGALFMPALWGPGHGQWFMVLFYPLWLVLDNLIYAAVHGTGSVALAVVAGVMAAAFTVYYARHANYYGYLRVAGRKTPRQYLRGERVWTVLGVAVGVLFLVFATWYNLAIRPGLAV